MTSSDNLVSIEQAAKYLGVHWQTVRRHIKTKKLPIVKIGRAIRIRQTDLETFVKGQVPHEHIHEIEIRFVTKNRRKIESNLIKMGAKVVYHGHVIDHWFVPNEIKNMEEKSSWYDTTKGYGLRIREQDNGYTGKFSTTLEVKSLVVPFQHDTCLEHEINVANYEETKKLLILMNKKEMTTLDKDRLVYAYLDYKIVIDDIKNFQTGVEIELMSSKDREVELPRLRRLATKIGLDIKNEITQKSVTFLYMQEYARF